MEDMTESFRDELESISKGMGATYFGVAELAPATQSISEQGGAFLTRFPRAVSHGFVLMDAIVDALKYGSSVAALHTYWHHVYQAVNPRIDSISLALAQALDKAGFQAFIVPSSQTTDKAGLAGVLSHKLTAHLAGLGWIGKSALLITPKHGPRVRWGTVLTDAPLEVGTPMHDMCKDCHTCVEACPVRAFTRQPFDIPRPRSQIFAAEACDRYLSDQRRTVGVAACGMCVYVCPFGRKKSERGI